MVDEIRANGWRQGAILLSASHPALSSYTRESIADTDCCVVISQSCDVLCPNFDTEPTVEFLLTRAIGSEANGNFTHAKNARRLQFEIDVDGELVVYEAQARHRFTVPRSILASHRADANRRLTSESLSDAIQWIVARYSRHALPDNFNVRTSRVVDRKVKPILAGLKRLKALYIALQDWEELGPEKPYEVSLLGTMKAEDFGQPVERTAVEEGLTKIATALASCRGIEVLDAAVRSEADVTLDDVRYLVRWNFDYISLRDSNHA